MNIFNNIRESFVQAALHRGRFEAHQQFIKMSDDQLNEYGISRELLEEGISAWPWALDSAESAAEQFLKPAPVVSQIAPAESNKKKVRQAISELSAFSDRELAELGIARNSIEEVVRYGRPSVEGVFVNHTYAA